MPYIKVMVFLLTYLEGLSLTPRCCTKGDAPSLPCVGHKDDPLLAIVVLIDDMEIAIREAN